MTDDLSPRGRALLHAALEAEPALDGESRLRMRSKVLGVVLGASAAAATTSSVAAAATGGAAGAASGAAAPLASVGATFGMKGLAVLGIAALAASGTMLVAYEESRAPVVVEAPRPLSSVTPPARATSQLPPFTAPVEEPPPALVAPPPASAPPPLYAVSAESSPPLPPRTEPAAERGPPPDPAPAPTPPADDVFVKELAALDRARAALAANDPVRAITELDAAPPSASAFAEERAALRVVALCEAGRADAARRELASFRVAFPRSLQTARVERSCATRGVTDPASGGHQER